MNDDERVLRCAYEDSALWEVAAELGGRERAEGAVRRLAERGLVDVYVESGWPRLRRASVPPDQRGALLASRATWEVPEGALHAPTVGVALTEAGVRAMQARRR